MVGKSIDEVIHHTLSSSKRFEALPFAGKLEFGESMRSRTATTFKK
jgi:hypothetical protein